MKKNKNEFLTIKFTSGFKSFTFSIASWIFPFWIEFLIETLSVIEFKSISANKIEN